MRIETMMKRENQKGFTIIELIIVMAILAILAMIAVPKYGAVLSDSKTKAHEANLKMLQDSVDIYITNTGADPLTIDDINVLVDKGYLKSVPESPSKGSPYTVSDGNVGGGK